MSNLNQWGLIWGMFLSENDDRFMQGMGSTDNRAQQWMVVIPDYMQNYDHSIWTCPFADNEKKCVYDKDGNTLVGTEELRKKLVPALRAWTSGSTFSHLSYTENVELIRKLKIEGI